MKLLTKRETEDRKKRKREKDEKKRRERDYHLPKAYSIPGSLPESFTSLSLRETKGNHSSDNNTS